MDLVNRTPFAASLYGLVLPDGPEAIGIAVKGTWEIREDGPCVLVKRQPPVRMTPEHVGDPASSSIRYPADAGLPTPGTSCLLVADAVAPYRDASVVTVRFRVGPVSTTLLVFGDRQWERVFGVARPSDPTSFERLPLVWEHAFGGEDPSGAQPEHYDSNPIGTGFRARRTDRPLVNTPPPRIERADALVRSPGDRPLPGGTLPVAPAWQPRLGRAGTYGDAWRRDRAPLLPDDFDPLFSCVAPDDLVAVPPLGGGEPVRVEGVRTHSALSFALPRPSLAADAQGPTQTWPVALGLAVVVVEPDAATVSMTWRGAVLVSASALSVRVRLR